jgi:hypothetical protein
MLMKVFWSWQSDHLGKISRYFVRDALEQAIEGKSTHRISVTRSSSLDLSDGVLGGVDSSAVMSDEPRRIVTATA